jgi:putative aldouronate transport system substrate-binding protein
MKERIKHSYFILFTIFISIYLLCGCVKRKEMIKDNAISSPFNLSIMTVTTSNEPIKDDSPVKRALEEYTNTKISFDWVPSNAYSDKISIALTSNELPMIMFVPNKSNVIINAAREGEFWDITDYMKDYANLSKANPDILRSISIDNRIYGVYRSRPYARGGLAYRLDWLNNIGMKEVKTIDDVYNMLKGFTTKDPDKNGKDDTYGLVATSYDGSFNLTATWFGAPNGWGEDKDGKLIPAHMTEEYMEAMKFWRKLYEEKLVNLDFPVFSTTKWLKPITNGQAGAIIDISDVGQRMSPIKTDGNPEPTIDVAGAILGPKGLKNLPTSGYNGMYMITKKTVTSEEELKKALNFLDKLNDKKALDLLNNGIEGRQYRVIEDKYAEVITEPATRKNEINDLNQLSLGIHDLSKDAYIKKPTPLREKIMELQSSKYDIYCVPNPAEPFISETYLTKGEQLDNIIIDARVKYIIGQYSEQKYKETIEVWRKNGGDEVIREINNQYNKYRKK